MIYVIHAYCQIACETFVFEIVEIHKLLFALHGQNYGTIHW